MTRTFQQSGNNDYQSSIPETFRSRYEHEQFRESELVRILEKYDRPIRLVDFINWHANDLRFSQDDNDKGRIRKFLSFQMKKGVILKTIVRGKSFISLSHGEYVSTKHDHDALLPGDVPDLGLCQPASPDNHHSRFSATPSARDQVIADQDRDRATIMPSETGNGPAQVPSTEGAGVYDADDEWRFLPLTGIPAGDGGGKNATTVGPIAGTGLPPDAIESGSPASAGCNGCADQRLDLVKSRPSARWMGGMDQHVGPMAQSPLRTETVLRGELMDYFAYLDYRIEMLDTAILATRERRQELKRELEDVEERLGLLLSR